MGRTFRVLLRRFSLPLLVSLLRLVYREQVEAPRIRRLEDVVEEQD